MVSGSIANMQKNQLVLTFLTLFLLFLLFPLFWMGGSRGLLLPVYLSVGPLLAAGILFVELKKKKSIRDVIQKKLQLLSPALFLSLVAAVVFGVLIFSLMLFEWLVSMAVLGSLIQIVLIGVPLLLALVLLAGLLLIPVLLYFLVPLVPKLGWDVRPLAQGVTERLRRPWVSNFCWTVAPIFALIIALVLVSNFYIPFLFEYGSPSFALQWLFLSPVLAALFTYPLSYFYSKL